MMKKLVLVALLMMSVVAVSAAEKKEKRSAKEIVTTTYCVDMDCEGCVKEVMAIIPYQKGVKAVDVDLDSKEVEVSYDAAKNSDEQMIEAFKKIHKTATVKAVE